MATTERSLSDWFDRRAQDRPDVEAAVFEEQRMTYRELAELSWLVARRLLAAGVRRGDVVGTLIMPSPASLSVVLGMARLGALAVPVNARYKREEVRFVVEHSGMQMMIADARGEELMAAAAVELPSLAAAELTAAEGGSSLPASSQAEVEAVSAAVQPEDPVIVMYTSGTTARPKGALHSHANLVSQAHGLAERQGLLPDDRFWTALPLFHIGGIVAFLGAWEVGATFVHVGFFDPDHALEQLERERCTVAFPAFEAIWLAVLDHPRFATTDLSDLRLVLNVATPERLRLMQERILERAPGAIQVTTFGSTESCGFLSMAAPGDSLELRTETSGRPLPGMELRIISIDSGEDVEPGGTGEAWFRGLGCFLGYHNDPEYTASVIDADGWFHSGDLLRDAGGSRIAFAGRVKDMLKVGGENVAAAEVEDFIAAHPAVKMVQVVSAPDARYTEVPAAFVELHPGASVSGEELIERCLGEIATFKVPRYVRFVEEWPLAGTGKVQKHRLRERIARELEEAGIREAPKLASSRG